MPSRPGVYAWYFDEVPSDESDNSKLHYAHGLPLLYIGISPARPPKVGAPGKQSLRARIRYHYRGNAFGSTLRLTLGCLLSDRLGIELRRVGSGRRLTFSSGEDTLNAWMSAHAFVCWSPMASPWEAEFGGVRLFGCWKRRWGGSACYEI